MAEAKSREYAVEYIAWWGMKRRCYNPTSDNYRYYGGRGITVDPAWMDFYQFLADIGCRPSPAHSLDRIDNDGPYSKANCRWATWEEQVANRKPKDPPGWREKMNDLAMTKTTPADRAFYVTEEELIRAFGLSWREAQFLQALMIHSIGGPDAFPALRNPRQYIYMLRRKLNRVHIEINSCGGQHYAISIGDRKKILTAVKNPS